MKRKQRIGKLSLPARLSLLRRGCLRPDEVAEAAADFGTESFVEAKPDVEKLLDYPDSIVRYSAMSALAYEWGASDRIERFIDIALHDSDEDCRRQAAAALGSLFRGSADTGISRVLAGVVADETELEEVRCTAYSGLLDVVGVPRSDQPDRLSLKLGDIDWDLVRKHAL